MEVLEILTIKQLCELWLVADKLYDLK